MKHTGLGALMKRLPLELQKKIAAMSCEAVDEAARRFVHCVGLRFKASDWFNGLMPPSALLEGDVTNFEFYEHLHSTSHFIPFVEKIVVPQGSKLCVIGDVHGDLAYLVDVLAQLQQQGLLDADYRLIDPTAYIGLVGDYTNRNTHSVEVMLVLFYLYRHNLGRVFLLRGNHEYAISTRVMYDQYQQFLGEPDCDVEHTDRPRIRDAFIAEMGRKFSLYSFPDLLYWFDFLPLAVYIGCYDEQRKQDTYISLSHGGIEPGYNPSNLLAGEARFERLGKLERNKAMQELFNACHPGPELDEGGSNPQVISQQSFDDILARLSEVGMHSFVESYAMNDAVVDLMQNHNPFKIRIGMQWNSFLTDTNDAIVCAGSQRHRNLLFGRALTNYFLAQSSTTDHRLVSFVRGHQHLDDLDPVIGLDSPMLSQLRERQGIVRQWDGLVYTMGDGGSATGWQAFLMVTTGKTLQDWTATHYFRNDRAVPFEKKVTPFIATEK